MPQMRSIAKGGRKMYQLKIGFYLLQDTKNLFVILSAVLMQNE
jgi:hypothetical protein